MRTFKIPIIIALLTLLGLLLSLIGDGLLDWISCIMLLAPIIGVLLSFLKAKNLNH